MHQDQANTSINSLIEILPAHKIRNIRLRSKGVRGAQFESAVAVAMRVVILREGLAMEAFVSYL